MQEVLEAMRVVCDGLGAIMLSDDRQKQEFLSLGRRLQTRLADSCSAASQQQQTLRDAATYHSCVSGRVTVLHFHQDNDDRQHPAWKRGLTGRAQSRVMRLLVNLRTFMNIIEQANEETFALTGNLVVNPSNFRDHSVYRPYVTRNVVGDEEWEFHEHQHTGKGDPRLWYLDECCGETCTVNTFEWSLRYKRSMDRSSFNCLGRRGDPRQYLSDLSQAFEKVKALQFSTLRPEERAAGSLAPWPVEHHWDLPVCVWAHVDPAKKDPSKRNGPYSGSVKSPSAFASGITRH